MLSSRVSMATPTRMNPIWDREEQARMYLRLVENAAITAPSTMVMQPSISTRTPQLRLPGSR